MTLLPVYANKCKIWARMAASGVKVSCEQRPAGHERAPNHTNLQRGKMRLDRRSRKVPCEGPHIYWYDTLASEDGRMLRADRLM